MLQELYWKEFYRLKVHICLLELHLSKTEKIDRNLKIFLAISSSASIGAWTIWKDHAMVWSIIIAGSQVITAIQHYLPYKNRKRNIAGLIKELEDIFLLVEAKWLEIAAGTASENSIKKELAELRKRRTRAFQRYFPDSTIPEENELLDKAETTATAYFNNLYITEDD